MDAASVGLKSRQRVGPAQLTLTARTRAELSLPKLSAVPTLVHSRCDPVHNRRIYSAQSHFDAHLLHDDHTRTLDPAEASLFYVPLFLNQRVTWGASLVAEMRAAVRYIRGRYPFWNASSGTDHVWFIFGERQTCLIPREIAEVSIIVGHWGDEDCMVGSKDVVVPTITPVQHDYDRYTRVCCHGPSDGLILARRDWPKSDARSLLSSFSDSGERWSTLAPALDAHVGGSWV